tara:strand:+ start:5340 stop:5852 length:513 start_codon:yes stop_codon:yes gene_type:complete
MPERVTPEERLVSLLIQKARDVKTLLHQSINDNNRSPVDDDSEAVKLKRPKAENAKDLIADNRKGDGYGLGGQMTHFKKAVVLMKAILKEEMDNPFLNEERKNRAIADLEATEKELEDLQQMFKQGMEQKEFEDKFGAMLRRLTEMQQMLGGQPNKDPAVPLIPAQNQYR